jgi:Tol biopolymer transport system component
VSPVISPDGAWVAFGDIAASPSRIMKLPLGGGTAQVVADSGQNVRWSEGDLLSYSWSAGIWTSTPARRAGKQVVTPDTAHGIYGVSFQDVLPGNTHALVSLTTTRSGPPLDSMRLGVVSLTDGVITDLGVRGTFAHYVPTGHILFARRPGLLMVAPFSLRERRITGPETVLLENIWIGTGGAGGFAVSENGTLAVHPGFEGIRLNLVAVDRRGAERLLPGQPQEFVEPRVSPDGARILVRIGGGLSGGSTGTLVLIDAGTGITRTVAQGSDGYGAVWSRDGVHAMFLRRTAGGTDVVRKPWEDRASETVIARALPRNVRELSPGPAGGLAALVRERGTFGSELFLAPMDSLGALRPFVMGQGRYHSPVVSPDGKLVAWFGVDGNELDKGQIFVSPIPGPGPRVQVSVGGGHSPLWDPSGTRLYYRGPRRVMVADLTTSPLQVTRRDSMFEDPYMRSAAFLTRNWDFIPGRNEFLMVQPVQQRASVPRVVLNWPQLMGAAKSVTQGQ